MAERTLTKPRTFKNLTHAKRAPAGTGDYYGEELEKKRWSTEAQQKTTLAELRELFLEKRRALLEAAKPYFNAIRALRRKMKAPAINKTTEGIVWFY